MFVCLNSPRSIKKPFSSAALDQSGHSRETLDVLEAEAVTDRIFCYFPSQAVPSELYFNPGVLLPPTPLRGSVPLYNPSQVPQVRES